MGTIVRDEYFLELESFLGLTSKNLSVLSGGHIASNFWTHDKVMKRKQLSNPEIKDSLLKMKYKDGFRDYFGFQELRLVLENFHKERFSAAEHPKWISLLKGETVVVPNNVIHVRSDESYLERSKENLQRAAVALLETWVVIPRFISRDESLERFRVDHFVDFDSVCVTETAQLKNGSYAFTIVFDTRVKLFCDFDRSWNPALYREPRDFGRYSRFKLIWDLLNYTEKFRIEQSGYNLYPCLNPTSWEEFFAWMEFIVAEKDCGDFMRTMQLLSEFSTGGEFDEDLKKLEKFQEGKFLYGVRSTTLFSKNIKQLGVKSLTKEISYVQDLLDGLKAAEAIFSKYGETLNQSNRKNVNLGKGLCLIIARKVALDPVSYVDDSRIYVSELARNIISGVLDVGVLPAYEKTARLWASRYYLQ